MTGINFSLGGNEFPYTVEEIADKFFDRLIDRLFEKKGDLNIELLENIFRSQASKEIDKKQYPNFKLLLKTDEVNSSNLRLNLSKSHKILESSGFIEGNSKDFMSIFWPGEPLTRRVVWLGDNIEMKYLICKLSGKQLRESPTGKKTKITIVKTGKSVFWNDKQIFQKAANSFLNKAKGKSIIPKNAFDKAKPRTYLKEDRLLILDKVAVLLGVAE